MSSALYPTIAIYFEISGHPWDQWAYMDHVLQEVSSNTPQNVFPVQNENSFQPLNVRPNPERAEVYTLNEVQYPFGTLQVQGVH